MARTPAQALDPIARPAWLTEDVWPFEVNTLQTDGGRVAYTDVGSGPVLLFVHAGMWSFVWRDVIASLSNRYRCVTFDPLGSGLSDLVPAGQRSLTTVRDSLVGLVEELELTDVTLVLHDLGGPAAMAAASRFTDRLRGLVATGSFVWKPSGFLFRLMLWLFGSAVMREVDAYSGWLPALSTTRFGVGRRLDRASRRAFRRGMGRGSRRTMHLLFRSARRSTVVYEEADMAIRGLADRPLLTVFGQFGDYLRFRPKWRERFPRIEEHLVPRGLHFPMCDDPALVAATIDSWWIRQVALSAGTTETG